MTDLQEGVSTLLGWDIFGEASANYLLGCVNFKKVARGMFGLREIFPGTSGLRQIAFLPVWAA